MRWPRTLPRTLPVAALLLLVAAGTARAADGPAPCPPGTSATDATHCAQPAPPPARNLVTCRDGTFSKGGRGACRLHGGLRRGTEKAAPEPGTATGG
jgi:hypothetical protein